MLVARLQIALASSTELEAALHRALTSRADHTIDLDHSSHRLTYLLRHFSALV